MPEICLGESFNRGDLSGRALTAGAVVGGGAGYTDGQSVTVNADDGSGYGATGTVTVVGGAVTAVTIVAGGYGYGAGETIKIEGAGGAGATGTATVSAGDRSEEHTSELQSLMRISYAVFCLKKKK